MAGAQGAQRLARGIRFGSLFIKALGLLLLTLRVDALSPYTFPAKLVVLNAPRYGNQLVGNASYHVRKLSTTGEWVLYTAVFGPSAARPGPELKTGDAVQLFVDLDLSGFVPVPGNPAAAFAGAPGTLHVVSWAGEPFGSAPFGSSSVYYTGGLEPLRLSTAVWVVTSVCGVEVAGGMTAQDVSQVLFGPPAGAALRTPGASAKHYPPMSLNRLLYDCSYGNIVLKRTSTLVLNLSLPCGGVRPNGAAWNATHGSAGIAGACGNNELWGWMEYAVQNTQQALGVDPSAFRRRILVLPPTTASGSGSTSGGPVALCASWQQRGSFGCDEALGCDMWIRGDRSRLLQGLAGQLGASMLLQPAATSTSSHPAAPDPLASTGQPTDPTCPMGSAEEGEGRDKCFNGPNAYKLQLTQPALRLDASNFFFVGFPRVVDLPPAALSAASLLLVVPNWMSPPPVAPWPLYGQYRAPVGGDAGLPAATAAGRLVLHSVNASAPPLGLGAGPASVLLAVLSPGESYRFEPAQVVVSFQSVTSPPAEDAGGVTGGSATVAVCRYSAVSETGFDCYDGTDNDCDGLVDFDDPDCAIVMAG